MKKFILATPMALLAAPGFAQSSVTLFGVAEAQVGTWNNLVAAPVSRTNPFGATVESGRTRGLIPYGINASRIGFRGTEDLGEGLKANFILENQLAMDTGTTPARFFHRQANVGLSGSFGQIRLGRVYTAWNDVASNSGVGYGDTYDPYVRVWRVGGPVPLGSPTANAGGQLTGLAGSLGTNNDLGNPQVYTHVRLDKSVRYDTPSFNGVVASAQVGLNDTAKTPSAQSYAVVYDQGAVRAGVGYYRQNTKSYYDPATEKFNAALPQEGKLETLTVAFNYDFGPAKLVTMFGQSRYDLFSLSMRTTSREWSVGVTAPVAGDFLLKASVAGSDSKDLAGKDIGAALELHYNLSKRTAIYGAYSWSKYDELLNGQANRSSMIAAIGLRHFF